MSSEWRNIARCTGIEEPGVVGFHVNYMLSASSDEQLATERQVSAVRSFYGRGFPGLTRGQAHRLLSFREYSRLCATIFFKSFNTEMQLRLAACLAAFVSHDSEIGDFVVGWSNRNFEKGVDSPRVRGTPYFLDMKNFADYLVCVLQQNGAYPKKR
jgi:hypothetical protein